MKIYAANLKFDFIVILESMNRSSFPRNCFVHCNVKVTYNTSTSTKVKEIDPLLQAPA